MSRRALPVRPAHASRHARSSVSRGAIAGVTLSTLRRAGLVSVGYHDVALLDQIAAAARVAGFTPELRRKAVLDALEGSSLFTKALSPPVKGGRQERRFTVRGRADPTRPAPELPLDA